MNTPKKSKPWAAMNRQEKAVFVFKLSISILSFGFIYPNLMGD